MIIGGHITIASRNEDADKLFFRDVLNLPNVDAGGGYIIFGLPSGDVAVHEGDMQHKLHLMCADIDDFLERMGRLGIRATPVQQQIWGVSTEVTLPSGGTITVYEPTHKRPRHTVVRARPGKAARPKKVAARRKTTARKTPARKVGGRKVKARTKRR